MVKLRQAIPELDQAIEAHARAFAGGEREAAERFVAERGLESHRAAFTAAADTRPLDSFEVLARAKIGFQYVAKLRFAGAKGKPLLQFRWSEESAGNWRIVETEDLTVKRSAWSDIPPLTRPTHA